MSGRGAQQPICAFAQPRAEDAPRADEPAAAEDTPRGEALSALVYLDRASVENFARLSALDAPFDHAREQLLEAIASEGQLSRQPPAWMTSGKPGVDAYLLLGEHLALTLRHQPERTRCWKATNAIATRRRPNRNQQLDQAPRRKRLEGEALAEAQALSGEQLAQRTWLSVHSVERWAERAGPSIDDSTSVFDQLRQRIASDGRVLAPPPAWADASGRNEPVIVCSDGDDQLALALQPNLHPGQDTDERPYVATTCLSRTWAYRDFEQLDSQALAATLFVPSRVLKRLTPEISAVLGDDPEAALRARVAADGRARFDVDAMTAARFAGLHGPHAVAGQLAIALRPADNNHRQQGYGWMAYALYAATSSSAETGPLSTSADVEAATPAA